MKNLKNCHYKSALQYFNSSTQPVLATDLITNPVVVSLGGIVTDTGVAISKGFNSIGIEASGLYRISAEITSLGVTGGDITFALAKDGVILPETAKTITAVADVNKTIPLETVRYFNDCLAVNNNLTIVAYSDGTGVADITMVSGNVIKLA